MTLKSQMKSSLFSNQSFSTLLSAKRHFGKNFSIIEI